MRREIVQLVEAVRELEVQLAPRPEKPKNVKIGGDRETFPDRLWKVAVALEAVDRMGALGLSDSNDDPVMDATRLRMALDSVFRWMRSTGIDVTEPCEIVASALGVNNSDPSVRRGYKPVPQFAHNGHKKPVNVGPLINLTPKHGEKINEETLRQKELQASMTEASLGAAGPRSRLASRG